MQEISVQRDLHCVLLNLLKHFLPNDWLTITLSRHFLLENGEVLLDVRERKLELEIVLQHRQHV